MRVVTLQTQKQHCWELSYMQSRHRHEADRAGDRHELTFTLSIAMVTFGQVQQYSTRIRNARSRLPVATPQCGRVLSKSFLAHAHAQDQLNDS
jgi:hypothetical protein